MKYFAYKIYWTSVQILILITLAHIHACTAGSCFEETESQVKATFYSTETGKAQAPDSVTIYGINLDTMKIYDLAINLKSVELPLFGDDTERRFVIRINDINDTLEFIYQSYIHLLSKECGYTYFYTLDSVFFSGNVIDSISIVKNTITTVNEENMRIFY